MRCRLMVVFAMLVGLAVALPASAPTNVALSDYVAMRGSFSSGHGSQPYMGGALSRLAALLDRGEPLGTGSFMPAVFSPREQSNAVAPGVRSRAGLSALPVGLRTVASAAIGAQERRFWVLRHGDSLVASGGGIASVFSAAGVRLRVPGGSLRLSLAGVGYGDRLVPATAAVPAALGSSVSYRHGFVSEWYRNGPLGLEQGFTLRRRPRGSGGPLTLAIRTSGSLAERLSGSEVLFGSAGDTVALRYAGLSAVDASGRHLPAALALRGGLLLLRVSDQDARYPLTIDPLIQQGAKLHRQRRDRRRRLWRQCCAVLRRQHRADRRPRRQQRRGRGVGVHPLWRGVVPAGRKAHR